MPLDDTTWNAPNESNFTVYALNQLKRVLHEVEKSPHKRLNMWNFGTCTPLHSESAVCALGWAARDQWFIDRGLKLKLFHNFTVAENFFQITEKQVIYLFGPKLNWWSVPKVIERIDKVLNELAPNGTAQRNLLIKERAI